MKRKGRHTLEVKMWVWVCYNREVLLLCTPSYILLMTAHRTYHQSYFWHHKTCSYYSTMIKSGFTIQKFGTCFRAANYEVILLVWDGKLDGIHDHTPAWEFTRSKRYQIHFQHFKWRVSHYSWCRHHSSSCQEWLTS